MSGVSTATGARHDVGGARNTVGVTYAVSTMLSLESGSRFYLSSLVDRAARSAVNLRSFTSTSPPRKTTARRIRPAR